MVRVLMLLACLVWAAPASGQETWKIPEAGVELAIPEGWQLVEGPRGDRALRRIDAAGAGFSENINVVVTPAKVETLEALEQEVRGQVERGSVEFVKREQTTVAETDVVALEYRGAMRGVPVHWRLAAFLNHGRQVLITAAVLDERWASSRESLEALVAGLKIGELAEPEPRRRALHPTAGVSWVPPHGWAQLPPHSGGMWLLSRWALPGQGRQMRAMIDVLGEPAPPGTTLETVVEGFRKQGTMTLAEGRQEIDGEPARVFSNDAATGETARRVLVCVHDGVIFSVVLRGPPPAIPIWQQVVSSVTWHEREEPAQHVQTTGAPMGISPNLMLIPPGLLRLIGQGEGEVRFGIHDYKRSRGGMMLQLRGIGVEDPSVPTAGVRDQMGAQIAQQFGGAKPVWEAVEGGSMEAYLSQAVPGSDGQQLMFSILRTVPQAVIVINYVIFDDRPEAIAAYRDAVRAMLASAMRPPQAPGSGQPR